MLADQEAGRKVSEEKKKFFIVRRVCLQRDQS